MEWNALEAMPAGHEFEVYHLKDMEWTQYIFHSHAYFEFYIFLQGSINIRIEDRAYEDVQPYDLFIFPPGFMHHNTSSARDACYERAYFYITESSLRSMSTQTCDLAEMISEVVRNKSFHFHLGKERCLPLLKQMDMLARRGERARAIDRLVSQCQMTILVATLCETINSLSPDPASAANTRLAQIVRYVDRHYNEPLALNDLADQFYLSKYHLSREFKKYTGQTIHQYLLMKRIVHAQLLMQRGMSPIEAAPECGFEDYTGFYRAFRSNTGYSPREYTRILSAAQAHE